MATYTVRAGDTLSAIASRLGVPLAKLIEANHIADSNRIKAGQRLSIPAVSSPPLAIDKSTLRLPSLCYFAERHPKDLIVLHFTAGPSARSAFNTWAGSSSRIATAYIVDVDGTVYETFDPSYWAYHLGIKGAASLSHHHDKRSIGIEIANVGPLKPNAAGDLCWWPPQNRFERKWCSPSESDLYVKRAYRGFSHYASFPEAQVRSLSPLIQTLCRRFSIPARLPEPAQLSIASPSGYFRDFTGIASHQNFRADKLDVGPAFPWESLTV